MHSLIDPRSVEIRPNRSSRESQAGNQAGNRTPVRSATRIISLPYIAYPDHNILTELFSFEPGIVALLLLDRISISRRQHHEVGATWKL